MTRIFEALRKSRALAPPPMPGPVAASPLSSPVPRPPAFTAPVSRAPAPEAKHPILPPPAFATLSVLPPMSEDVVREMGTLRVHLEAALTERRPRTVMLVSAQGGEGTTTVATQLALSLARDASIRVLLLDAHGRRPVLSTHATAGSVPRPAPNAKRKPRGEASDPAAAAALRVLPLPEEMRNPSGISAQELRARIESVESSFDWIIVDGPPVLESPDASSLAGVVSGAVMVIQAGRTKRPVLTRSVDLLRKGGARVLGTVLNRRRLEIPGFIYRRI